jgi:hypothetical protein
VAISGGLASAEQVEIGAVEHQHDGRHEGFSTVVFMYADKMYWMVNLVNHLGGNRSIIERRIKTTVMQIRVDIN